jgi:hypothetical protein
VGIGVVPPSSQVSYIRNVHNTRVAGLWSYCINDWGGFFTNSYIDAAGVRKYISSSQYAHNLHFDNNGSFIFYNAPNTNSAGDTVPFVERMRIDASGNFLVGKTSSDTNVEGSVLFADSSSGAAGAFTSDGNRTIIANRKTDDGEIISIRKDGTTVGSIGSISGVVSYINLDPRSGGTGIAGTNTDSIIPVTGTGAVANGTKDLGLTTARWRDLYLSEGISLSADDAGGGGTNTIGFKHTGNTAGYAAAIEASYSADFRANLIFKINTSQSNIAPIEVGRFSNSGNFFVGATALAADANFFGTSPGNAFSDFGHVTGVASGVSYTRFLYAGSVIGSITQSGTIAVLLQHLIRPTPKGKHCRR